MINEKRFVDAQNLYCSGRGLQIDKKEFRNAVKSYLLDTSEVCERMQCSRQYVNVLVKNNDLPVFKEIGNNRLYEYPEVERLKE